MKVKIFSDIFEGRLEDKINKFITSGEIEVIEIKFSAHAFGFAAMVTYKSIL